MKKKILGIFLAQSFEPQVALDDEIRVLEESVEKATGWQQRLQVDDELEKALDVVESILDRTLVHDLATLGVHIVLVVTRLFALEHARETSNQVAQERTLEHDSLAFVLAQLAVRFLDRLPEFLQLGQLAQLVLASIVAQRHPHGQRTDLLDLHAHEIVLE